MSALLESQESSATGQDAASRLIADLDSDGDGALSLDEIGKALGQTDTSGIADAFAALDGDGDGVMSAGEVQTGLEAMGPPAGGPPPGGPPPGGPGGGAGSMSAEDTASAVIDAADADADGAVSLNELTAALDPDDASSVSDAFAALDSDGDGGLSASELTSAFQSLMSRQVQAYGREASAETTGGVSLAA